MAFDLPAAKILGTAKIDAVPGTELKIHRGDLRILSLTNGSRHTVPGAREEDPLTVRAEGPIQLRYEGIFTDPPDDVISEDTIVLRTLW